MNSKKSLVQLHMHTADTSRCGVSSGAEMARAAKELGYDLLVITDHFFNANIGCDKKLPWEQKVEYLTRGYKAAKSVGDIIGLKVLFGWETCNAGPEYLTYGLGTDFLLDNPDIAEIDGYKYLERVRNAGGFVIHAHPFRRAPYIPIFTPDAKSVEAFEVFNASHRDPTFNELALKMAREYGLIECAGSDAHEIGELHGGAMLFDGEIGTNDELISAIRARAFSIVEKL